VRQYQASLYLIDWQYECFAFGRPAQRFVGTNHRLLSKRPLAQPAKPNGKDQTTSRVTYCHKKLVTFISI
jgi:hypothetical protein